MHYLRSPGGAIYGFDQLPRDIGIYCFPSTPTQTGDAKFKVEVSDGRTLQVSAGEPLMNGLERKHF